MGFDTIEINLVLIMVALRSERTHIFQETCLNEKLKSSSDIILQGGADMPPPPSIRFCKKGMG